jgi:hypothetical protein
VRQPIWPKLKMQHLAQRSLPAFDVKRRPCHGNGEDALMALKDDK